MNLVGMKNDSLESVNKLGKNSKNLEDSVLWRILDICANFIHPLSREYNIAEEGPCQSHRFLPLWKFFVLCFHVTRHHVRPPVVRPATTNGQSTEQAWRWHSVWTRRHREVFEAEQPVLHHSQPRSQARGLRSCSRREVHHDFLRSQLLVIFSLIWWYNQRSTIQRQPTTMHGWQFDQVITGPVENEQHDTTWRVRSNSREFINSHNIGRLLGLTSSTTLTHQIVNINITHTDLSQTSSAESIISCENASSETQQLSHVTMHCQLESISLSFLKNQYLVLVTRVTRVSKLQELEWHSFQGHYTWNIIY